MKVKLKNGMIGNLVGYVNIIFDNGDTYSYKVPADDIVEEVKNKNYKKPEPILAIGDNIYYATMKDCNIEKLERSKQDMNKEELEDKYNMNEIYKVTLETINFLNNVAQGKDGEYLDVDGGQIYVLKQDINYILENYDVKKIEYVGILYKKVPQNEKNC